MATIEEGLEAARQAKGNSLLVIVSPRQAELLLMALQVTERLLVNYLKGDTSQLLDGCTTSLLRYQEIRSVERPPTTASVPDSSER
jgi:hypothetical protein